MENVAQEESFYKVLSATALSNGTYLGDITVNQSEMPCGSPKASKGTEKMVSPGRVRTMKEYEEQMAELKKENFNLKLRIYFIEERQEQMKGLKDVDELFKKNVELSCELESLKKDLSEKEELLLQSAKAVEILQNQHKKQLEDLKQSSLRDKTYLEDHINNLQKVLREKEQTISQFDDSSAMYAMAFGYNKGPDQSKEVEELKTELNNVTLKVVQLEEQLQEERKRYFALECELEQAHEESVRLKSQISSLETDVEKRDARLQQAYLDLDRKTEQLNALTYRHNKKEKTKTDQLLEKDQKVNELEGKIVEMERRLQVGGGSSAGGGRKSSVDSASSGKDVAARQRLRRFDEKCLSKELQDAHIKLFQLEEQTQAMQTKLHEAQLSCHKKDSHVVKLQEDHHKACVTIQALLKKNKLQEKQLSLLQIELEKREKVKQEMSPPYKPFPQSDNCENGDKNNENLRKRLDVEQEKLPELSQEQIISTNDMESQIQSLNLSVKEGDNSLDSFAESKDNRIAELESKLEEMKIKLLNIQHENKYDEAGSSKTNTLKDYDDVVKELEIKKKEVEYLNLELKKRTYNLQELVNKELWNKNREIEKLNKLCERLQIEIMQLKQQLNSNDVHVPFTHEKQKDSENFNNLMMREKVQMMNYEEVKDNSNPLVFSGDDKKTLQEQLMHCWEERKFLIQKVEELEGRLQNMPERDSDSRLVQTLKSDLIKTKQEVEMSEKSRKEVVTACSLLTNRLQELADFLDSLLPSLGAKKRRVVQHAVERSRELSRSFSAAADDANSWQNLQPSLYTPLLPDFSTVDFWSGDDITDLTLEEEANDEVDTIAQLRSEVELLREELKQKDLELTKLNSQFTPTFQSMWSLGTNEFESINAESNNLAKLVSMFESLETIENSKEDKINDGNIDTFVTGKNSVLLKNELKSSNIGEIIITSRKVSSKEDKGGHNIGSESEAWSEPDRSVSLARIGLTDDVAVQSWVHDDSSDTTDNGQRNSSGGKRTKYDAGELRRLQNKIRTLEEANEALRGELNILHLLAPPALGSREDKSTSIEGISDVTSVPSNLLDEIRNQREKLESSLVYNEKIRRQLETIFALLKVDDKDVSQIQQLKELKDDLLKSKTKYNDLENHCKALEAQCNDLEVALHSERSTCNKKEEECTNMTREITVLKEEQKIWKDKAELLQNEIEQLESELKLKCNEVLEKHNELLISRDDAHKQFNDFERRIKEAESLLKENRDRWLEKENQIQRNMKTLQNECDDLTVKLKKISEEKNEINLQLERLKLENDINKKELNDVSNRLEECKNKEEKALLEVEEWKLKWFNCQKEAEEANNRLQDAEQKIHEMEKINSELELGLRVQVEAASKQCTQAEFKLKDLEMKHKHQEAVWRGQIMEAAREQNEREVDWRRQLDAATLNVSEMVLERTRLANDKLRLQQEIRRRDTSQLEKVKSELERRVAELEAANSELEARLTTLHVTKMPSDSENDEQDNISNFSNLKHIKWPSTSTSPPSSPSSKPISLHLPLSPRYTSQRSNDISSDYMSDQDNGQTSSVFWPQRSPISASPDLGIESDQGRLSSLEANQQHPHNVSRRIGEGTTELTKLEEENLFLRQHLVRTRQALENTLSQLTAANHKKRQVERAICRQLGKTQFILQKARVNLEADIDGC
ncbi:uncharacterized protein LOC142318955 isoform X3 [Lycorma delicatula]|uniref:uncharacterized protein LOC142318955 isoform X3 n=1 Tax=Lycorma delicatula TaxID=130591 RepID=UPI003F510362